MLPSRFSFNQQQAPQNPLKRKLADGYESDDFIEAGHPWGAFKKRKPLQVTVEQREPSPMETPSAVELPDPRKILSLGNLPIDLFLEGLKSGADLPLPHALGPPPPHSLDQDVPRGDALQSGQICLEDGLLVLLRHDHPWLG
ncbi:hypothetical protein M407DRAFT_31395 [Tulasnella calospora MUT 4182]|uniref:Uncharacterized protein n=1 Tax=Tulasnella calospora MUT 4182 TaxID=1051891 RepID=A0A0C3Q5P1_9AGAM|nr:hypothetical protein M407DRAFT_31395 [Tulasnella calospora MUT 4182]